MLLSTEKPPRWYYFLALQLAPKKFELTPCVPEFASWPAPYEPTRRLGESVLYASASVE
jgi:hypothetical protein